MSSGASDGGDGASASRREKCVARCLSDPDDGDHDGYDDKNDHAHPEEPEKVEGGPNIIAGSG
jgi:hypothetical protein